MNDARWPLLKKVLIAAGWTLENETLHAPNRTLWFKQNENDPNYAEFRDRMSEFAEECDVQLLKDDLTSLVGGLDVVLMGN